MDHIPLNIKEVKERYKFRKSILDLFYKTLEERDIRKGVLEDTKKALNDALPVRVKEYTKIHIEEHNVAIEKLDKELKRLEKLLNYIMTSDIKGEYPFRNNEGGHTEGKAQYYSKQDHTIIMMAHDLGYFDLNLPIDEVTQILNKILNE